MLEKLRPWSLDETCGTKRLDRVLLSLPPATLSRKHALHVELEMKADAPQ